MPRTVSPAPVPDTTDVPITWVPLAELRPHSRNDGRHPAEELAHLKQSLQEHGVYRNVVIAADGTILAGHGVVQAAQALGHTQILARRMPYGPNDPQALKILVGDNHIARLRMQDDAALVAVLQDLAEHDPLALLGTGFDEEALEALVAAQGLGNGTEDDNAGRDAEPQIDRAEELRDAWGVEAGQLWSCGPHRVLCGDCTDQAVVERLMHGRTVMTCLADPPYNVGLSYGETVDDARPVSEYAAWNRAWFHLARHYTAHAIVITPGMVSVPLWLCEVERTHYLLAWTKANNNSRNYIGVTSGFQCWEPILVYGKAHTTILRDWYDCPIGHQADAEGHPCPKPLRLWQVLLADFSEEADVVYDPFLGAGTTLIACENLQRICYGCELDPGYVAVTLQRWADVTGQQPERMA